MLSLTHEIHHGASPPDPHETRVPRVNRNAAGRIGSRGVRNLTGRLGSAQQVFKSRRSGRVGSNAFQNSRVGTSRVKRFSKSRGSGRVRSKHVNIARVESSGDPTRPDPTREVCPDPRKALLMSIFLLSLQQFLQSSP